MRGRRGVLVLTALALGWLGMPAVQVAAAGTSVPVRVAASGQAAAVKPRGRLPVLGGDGAPSHTGYGTAAAIARAGKTGKSVAIPGLTSPTQTVTVDADGLLLARESVLPLPADAISFSPGGPGPMATIAAGGAKLTLSWPGPLPAPVVRERRRPTAMCCPG